MQIYEKVAPVSVLFFARGKSPLLQIFFPRPRGKFFSFTASFVDLNGRLCRGYVGNTKCCPSDCGFVDSILSSMSRKGNCYDNAAAKTLFSTIKNELVHLTKFRTRAEAHQMLFEYIEIFNNQNRHRRHTALKYLPRRSLDNKI